MKALGAEIVNFYKSADWPTGLVFDYGDGIDIEDESGVLLKMDEKYDLHEFNPLYLDEGDPYRQFDAWGTKLDFREGSLSFETVFKAWRKALVFKAWRKALTTRTLVVEVPLDTVEAFKAWAADHKCKVRT